MAPPSEWPVKVTLLMPLRSTWMFARVGSRFGWLRQPSQQTKRNERAFFPRTHARTYLFRELGKELARHVKETAMHTVSCVYVFVCFCNEGSDHNNQTPYHDRHVYVYVVPIQPIQPHTTEERTGRGCPSPPWPFYRPRGTGSRLPTPRETYVYVRVYDRIWMKWWGDVLWGRVMSRVHMMVA